MIEQKDKQTISRPESIPLFMSDLSPEYAEEARHAAELLRRSGIEYSSIGAENPGPPVLFTDDRPYRGLESIKKYVERQAQKK